MDSRAGSSHRPGPLAGVRVVEVGGIGPGPFAAMMLSDLGADVVRVDRPEEDLRPTHAVLLRGRRSVVADLKAPDGLALVLALVDRADILIEGFRPGVAERLGFGPSVALERNPRLVYGRMTGWGQDGPYAAWAGHDLTYLAVAGVLDAFAAEDGRPVPPLNLLGDFGGGGMMLALGVVSALWHARESGQGQVVDAAIVDGVAAMTAMHQSMLRSGLWLAGRGANLFDGGAPFYRCYRTSDDRWLAVGAIEPVFYDRFVRGLGLDGSEVGAAQLDAEQWPRLAEVFVERVARHPLAHWVAVYADLDACVAPVLTVQEARDDPHLVARGSYAAVPGVPGLVQPAPAPRFSATPTTAGPPATEPGSPTAAVERQPGRSR